MYNFMPELLDGLKKLVLFLLLIIVGLFLKDPIINTIKMTSDASYYKTRHDLEVMRTGHCCEHKDAK